jgi:hypothetical protein
MAAIHIRELYTGAILHSIQVEGRSADPFPLDLHDSDLSNLCLNGADLQWANLEGCNLRGTKFKGANLFHANLKNADIRYCDFSQADLREACLENVDSYPLNADKRTKLWDARIDPGSELAAMSQAVTKAKLRRSDDVEEFDVWQAKKATAALLDPNTKHLEKKIAQERKGWSQNILKAKLRVLRYSREIELNKVRRERDLIFLSRQGVDISFAGKLIGEDEIG